MPAGLRRRTVVPILLTAALLAPAGVAQAEPAAPDGAGHGLDLDAATIPFLEGLMATHRLTAVQLTQAYLDRIHRLDPQLGAVLAVNGNALQDAAASDQERRRSGPRSPLE